MECLKDPLAVPRKALRPLADKLVRATPAGRAELARYVLRAGLPASLRLLAEVLVGRLTGRPGGTRDGGVASLALLGQPAADVISLAVLKTRNAGRLEALAEAAEAV